FLDPFSRAQQPILLTVPTTEHDAAPRLPTLFQQSAKSARHFQHCRSATVWIHGAKRPGVAMITHHYPAIFFLVAIDSRYDIPNFPYLIIHISFQVHSDVVVSANVISKGQTSLKALRPQRSIKRFQEAARISIRDWLDGNMRQRRGFFHLQAW